ncbi:glycosyltransferase family 2 protein [Azospirillum palustre]
MKILLPMALPDQLFKPEDFFFPKPLVEVNSQPMIKLVIDNLRQIDPNSTFIFIVNREQVRRFSLDRILNLLTNGNCHTIALERLTQGAVCSCLMAADLIDNDEPLLIANSDQIIDGIHRPVHSLLKQTVDAGVVVFDSVHPRWSYVQTDAGGLVTEAAEKQVISRMAIAGLYFYRRGSDFVRAAERQIENEAKVNDAYYLSSTLNELVLDGKKVGYERINASDYHSLFSPPKVEEYERALQRQAFAILSGQTKNMPPVRATILIPMAGRGSRFADAGYDKPKPFIDVNGLTMIERVMDNLQVEGARYVLLPLDAHLKQEPAIADRLGQRPDITFCPITQVTEGTACTVLQARAAIDPHAPLLIANCDQLVDVDCSRFIEDCFSRGLDGSIMVFRDAERNPKWSFARLNEHGLVAEVREKVAISDLATVGIYFFARGGDFIRWATDMIVRNDRVNGEFYTCPVYNYGIQDGARIGVYEIAADAMHGLGTPTDLEAYLADGGAAV